MTEILWTGAELSAIWGVTIAPELQITGVQIDSRQINAGDLFVALPGTQTDGHDFVHAAAAAGAVAALVSRIPTSTPILAPTPETMDTHRFSSPKGGGEIKKILPLLGGDTEGGKANSLPPNFTLILVPDVMAALIALAKASRQRFQGKMIGVTGSVGKTGTKDMLAHVLRPQGKTYATVGNLNNHLGVPLSLARLPRDTEYAVLEMGMNHPGEIAPLSELCEPYVGIVTAIAPAHIEFFPTGLAGIADEKAQITAGMGPNSVAIFNRDTPYFDRQTRTAESRKIGRIIGFGEDGAAQSRLLSCAINTDHTAVQADILGTELSYCIGALGKHFALNSLAVLAAIDAIGANVTRAAEALGNFTAPAGRGAQRQVPLTQGQITLIDETYNASPESMRAALAVLGAIKPAAQGRRIVGLGDMRELGEHGPAMHADLAPAVLAANPAQVFLCGALMQHLADALQDKIPLVHTADSTTLAPILHAVLRPDDVVMLKGSLGSKMRLIVESLEARGEREKAHG